MTLKVFFTAILCLAPLRAAVVPNGSELEVRLLHRVGTRVSHAGDPVEAVVITPVFDHNRILIPAGATVSGVVDRLDRLGFGLRHPAARLDFHFTELHLSDENMIPIEARLATVEEARERVDESGAVVGIHPSASFSTGVSCVFSLFFLGAPEFRLPVLGFKFLAARSPDAEITFPAGTEMLLRLTSNLELNNLPGYGRSVPPLAPSQITAIERMLARLPEQQTNRDDKHPSDLINVLLIGSQAAVERAFRAAGWYGTEPHNVMALYQLYHCVVERVGYSRAPMTNLLLGNHPPDASFQKSLNTLAKRHHIRLWHEEESGMWLGAATEDVKYKIRALHLTHGTDHYIDNERAKVANDLIFTDCVNAGALVPRASFNPVQRGANAILTDGDVAVLQLNACEEPRIMPSDPQKPRHVRAIRAALAVGEDIGRSNPVSVSYAITNSILNGSKSRATNHLDEPGTYMRRIAISKGESRSVTQAVAAR
jgi:hypothetical protein